MKIFNNNRELIGEITTIVKPGEAVIQTNTTYNGDRVVAQAITRREYGGVIRTFETFCSSQNRQLGTPSAPKTC